MKIRAMVPDDHPDVLEVVRSVGIFNAEEERVAIELVDTYLGRRGAPDDYEVAIVENGAGRACGFVCYGPTPLTEGTMDLYWLAVHAEHQKNGFGAALVSWLEKTALERLARLIVIETSSTEPYAATRRFYERMGYVEQARIVSFYRPGEDRVIYCKYLTCSGCKP